MTPKTAASSRDPDRTRACLLQSAFAEVYRHGFQAASLDRILEGAGVTKGALYHHFASKSDLGYAVVDEVIRDLLERQVLGPLSRARGDAITVIQTVLRQHTDAATDASITLGCPVNNLAQEMSPLDEEFRRRLEDTLSAWRDGFARVLALGQARGEVRPEIDPEQLASFILAAFEGSIGLAKNARRAELFRKNIEVLCSLLEGLRPGGPATGASRRGTRRSPPRHRPG